MTSLKRSTMFNRLTHAKSKFASRWCQNCDVSFIWGFLNALESKAGWALGFGDCWQLSGEAVTYKDVEKWCWKSERFFLQGLHLECSTQGKMLKNVQRPPDQLWYTICFDKCYFFVFCELLLCEYMSYMILHVFVNFTLKVSKCSCEEAEQLSTAHCDIWNSIA